MNRMNKDSKKNKNIKNTRKNTKNKKTKKSKKEKKSGFFGFLLKLFFIIVFLLGIVCGFTYYKVKENGGGTKGFLITVLGLSVDKVDALDSINVLLLGISEDIDSKLTDTIIVCSYNPKNGKMTMLSIPRDTFIGTNKNSAKGSDKINSMYSKKGIDELLKKVSNITGMEIDNYVVVNNQALIEIVDILGGIEFDVPIDMDYDDPTQDLHIHLKKGMQVIDGEKAEQLLRFRHNNDGSSYSAEYGDNDFGRMKTQRSFITETVKQTIDVKNVLKAKRIIDSVFSNVETNMSKEQIKCYIPSVVDFNTENIESYQLPGQSEKCNELWFFTHYPKETKTMVSEIKLYLRSK